MRTGGFRRRLEVTIVGLILAVGFLAAVAGYVGVRAALRSDLLDNAVAQAQFAAAVLAPEMVDPPVDVASLDAFSDAIILRGADGLFVDLADDPYATAFQFNTIPADELRQVVDGGRIGSQWVELAGNAYLVVGARQPPDGPSYYFYHDATPITSSLNRLARILGVGLIALLAVSVLLARRVARGVLTPVAEGASAARRMAGGELSVRLDASGQDELAEWAASFNTMAGSLQQRIEELARSESFQRRFVSDVAHELRTPLTALVEEARLPDRVRDLERDMLDLHDLSDPDPAYDLHHDRGDDQQPPHGGRAALDLVPAGAILADPLANAVALQRADHRLFGGIRHGRNLAAPQILQDHALEQVVDVADVKPQINGGVAFHIAVVLIEGDPRAEHDDALDRQLGPIPVGWPLRGT